MFSCAQTHFCRCYIMTPQIPCLGERKRGKGYSAAEMLELLSERSAIDLFRDEHPDCFLALFDYVNDPTYRALHDVPDDEVVYHFLVSVPFERADADAGDGEAGI